MNLRLIPFLLCTHIERISFENRNPFQSRFFYMVFCDAVTMSLSQNTLFISSTVVFLLLFCCVFYLCFSTSLLLLLLILSYFFSLFNFFKSFFSFAIFKRVTTRPKPIQQRLFSCHGSTIQKLVMQPQFQFLAVECAHIWIAKATHTLCSSLHMDIISNWLLCATNDRSTKT